MLTERPILRIPYSTLYFLVFVATFHLLYLVEALEASTFLLLKYFSVSNCLKPSA